MISVFWCDFKETRHWPSIWGFRQDVRAGSGGGGSQGSGVDTGRPEPPQRSELALSVSAILPWRFCVLSSFLFFGFLSVSQKKFFFLIFFFFAFIRVKHQMAWPRGPNIDRSAVFLNSASSTSINYLFCSFMSRPSHMQNLSRFKLL